MAETIATYIAGAIAIAVAGMLVFTIVEYAVKSIRKLKK